MHCCHPRIPLSGAPSGRVGKIRKMSNFPPEKCLKICHLQWSQTLKRDNGWFAMTSIGNLPIRYYLVIDLGFIFSSLTYILKCWFARLPGNCRPHGLWITVCKHSQVTDLLKSSPWKAVKKKGPWEVLRQHNDYNHSYSCKCGFKERFHLMIVSWPYWSLSLGLKAELGHHRLAFKHQDESLS